jgi:DNA-binding CsgD family transcriptional regulator
MSGKTGWENSRSLFLLICILSFSSLTSGQQGGSNDEIRKFISGAIPVLSQNWEICRDPVSRYIYFANSAGLIEFNGITARTYTVPSRQGVRSVYVNNDGMIFTGSFEDFGIWSKDMSGRLSYASLAEETDISKNDEIWNIYELDHSIYFQSFTAVYIFDYNVVRKVETPSFMLFFFRVGERFMAQALGTGLYWFDGSGFTFIEGSEPFGSLKVHALIDFGADDQWICTANDGIFAFDGINFTSLNSEISLFLKEFTCNAGLAANENMIVFGTILKGVAICDRSGRILETVDYSNGLNNNTVLSLYLDDSGGIWAGLDDGANYILTSSHVTYYANTSGALGTIYTAIRDQDHLYLGTNHGLFAADISPDDGNYRFSDLRIIPNTQGQVWKLAQYDGQILCGHNEGTFVINGGKAEQISDVTGGWSFKPYGDLLLEGTYTGIVSFGKNSSGKWVYRNRIEGYIEPTRFLEIDYLGYVWAVHPQKGIYRLELNEQADSIVSSLYFSLLADSSKILSMSNLNNQVVFMASDHIFAFDYEKQDFFPVTSLEPGLGEFVGATQIIGYHGNSYWFVLDNRIALFNVSRDLQAEKVLEFVHEYADLPWREQQIISLDSARLLIPTRQAFSIYDIEKLSDAGPRSDLNFSRLIFSGGNKSTTLFPGATETLSVSSRENNLSVYIANPAGFDREGREYLYRITELGEEWYRTAADNFTLLNLRHGEYHLQVREAGGNDLAETLFIIRRPFLLTGWAWVLYVLVVAGLIAAGVRLFRMSLERHRRMIEYEVGKNRLESELDYKSYELMLTMRYLIRKTDTLRELRDKLESVKESSARMPVRFIREMEHIIDHGLDTQTEEWQNVMKNLKMSQEGFFSKLKKKYPALTPNDLRLCSYLRMNFTTKEIANLSNISTRAVEIGRYRLRSKLKLNHDVNLTEFLIREADTDDQ